MKKTIILLSFVLAALASNAQKKDSSIIHQDNGSFASMTNSAISTIDSNGNSIEYDITNDAVYINGDTTQALKFTMQKVGELMNQLNSIQEILNNQSSIKK